MARIRTIKPTFFRSEDVAALSYRARLTWIGLWTYVDDNGNGKDSARLVKGEVWPLDDDVTADEVAADLDELEAAGRIFRYEADGSRYLAVTAFLDHQVINRPTKSKIPLPTHGGLSEDSVSAHGGLTEDSLQEGKGKEGKRRGREAPTDVAATAPLSRFCAKHPDGTDEPCRACGDARVAYEAAVKAAAKPSVTRPMTLAEERARYVLEES